MAHKSDSELIAGTHNTARFFTENRQIAWIALIATVAWGIWAYAGMPKRKDPEIPIREAQAVCPWPGVSAEKVEQLVTRKIEQTVSESSFLNMPGGGSSYGIRSTTLDGLAIVNVQLQENLSDTRPIFSDIDLKLKSINDLPAGAGPIQFHSDFGDTAALMLTVASPRESDVVIAVRASEIRAALERSRAPMAAAARASRYAVVFAFPTSVNPNVVKRTADDVAAYLESKGSASGIVELQGAGFLALDATAQSAAALLAATQSFINERFGSGLFDPDLWAPIVIGDPQETEARLRTVAGDKYTYRQLDEFTSLIERGLSAAPQVSKVTRKGVYPEEIKLEFSQSRLASYGIKPSAIEQVLAQRNIEMRGGAIEVDQANLVVHPSGDFRTVDEIGSVIIARSASGSPIYLRDLVDITRGYASPPKILNLYTQRDSAGQWLSHRAITLAVEMRTGEQIGGFGTAVDHELELLRRLLPDDLIIARTSDQPRQVRESTDLFMHALYEAIVLVFVVSLIGFWEWRSAVVIGLAIPLTLAMTFGAMHAVGLELQQVSIAALIIALGLLVDDPVVAGDAIKRDLDLGHPPIISSWLGPTKLARAILFATVTNIVAYLPFAMVTGDTGKFLITLPIVMTAALVASRIVSMTFVPLLGYYLLRGAKKRPAPMEERRRRGFSGRYYRVGEWCIEHRWKTFGVSLLLLAAGVYFGSQLKSAFFPNDVQYLAYVDIWLPNDVALSGTAGTTMQVEGVLEKTIAKFAAAHEWRDGDLLKSLTTFVGAGGPRFWVSVAPEFQQANYAQIVFEIRDKDLMPSLVPVLQEAVSKEIPGAYVDVRQLQTNPVKFPVEVHIVGRADVDPLRQQQDIVALRGFAARATAIFSALPITQTVRDDWGTEVLTAKLQIDPDRANLAGVTNQDVAESTAMALSGRQIGVLREGDRQIPMTMRLRRDQRSSLAALDNLYVYSSQGTQKVPLRAIAKLNYGFESGRIVRRDKFRAITVLALPVAGVLPSELLNAAMPQLREFERTLPAGYTMTLGGEYEKSQRGNRDLTRVLLISCALIFVALVIQFNNAVKPWLVFAAVPYGVVGALGALLIMGSPFGFMAFLGVCSLVGVIVSHVIVLFDFVEEMHEKGEPMIEAVLDAGIERLRPVMITVGAAVLALIPLAKNGGPLWQPMCYAQIGGLSLATLIELLLVPVLYAIFVLDLKWVKWEPMHQAGESEAAELHAVSAPRPG